MMKSTAVSPANIAFIKFWGKKNSKLNIPFNDSNSMNLDSCLTTTTVEFNKNLRTDKIAVNGEEVQGLGRDRAVLVLNKVRRMAKIKMFAKVYSSNNFPSDAGIASSASGFSALALASSKAAGLNLNKTELSILARLGSGSACRSIPDGFAYWKRGKDDKSSYAVQIAPPGYWDIRDMVAVVSREKKKSGSTKGHANATSGRYYSERQKKLPGRMKKIMNAIRQKDFDTFGRIIEEEAIDLHIMAMTSKPPIYYWNGGTMDVIHAVLNMREGGVKCFFTMDAGPNVHVICKGKDGARVKKELQKIPSCMFVISNKVGAGAKLIS